MNEAVRFLNGFAQALATMTLYADGHPARERAVDLAFQSLADLQGRANRQVFTFLETEVIHGSEPLRELEGWEWSRRLMGAGVQRLEFEEEVTREELEGLLEEVLARLTLTLLDSPETRQLRHSRIRFGRIGLQGHEDPVVHAAVMALDYSLSEEVAAVRWMHDEVARARPIPLPEAEAVVRSLSAVMHGDNRIILPLLRLRNHDEYTTTHSLNVAVLTMAMAEFLGYPAGDVRAFGIAGLLHDIGKVRIPDDLLNKPGKLTPEEREVINRHPVEGARIILDSEMDLDMAAMVAYEHHLMHDGGGYPRLHYCRTCHAGSRLAHVCDVYDALRTHRPYRAAWASGTVLRYIEDRAGTEFDPEVAHSFIRMMREWEPRFAELDDARVSLGRGGVLAADSAASLEAGPVAGGAAPVSDLASPAG